MAVEVRAPLGGGILNVLVEPGATIEIDDELVVLEAMKMQNLIYSPAAGTVKEILVKTGDTVESGALLIVIE